MLLALMPPFEVRQTDRETVGAIELVDIQVKGSRGAAEVSLRDAIVRAFDYLPPARIAAVSARLPDSILAPVQIVVRQSERCFHDDVLRAALSVDDRSACVFVLTAGAVLDPVLRFSDPRLIRFERVIECLCVSDNAAPSTRAPFHRYRLGCTPTRISRRNDELLSVHRQSVPD